MNFFVTFLDTFHGESLKAYQFKLFQIYLILKDLGFKKGVTALGDNIPQSIRK